MNARQALLSALVVSACVLGGALECGRSSLSEPVRRGQALYSQMCAVCHGAKAEGYAADQAPAIGHPAFLAAVSDALLEDAIAHGRTGTTMSAWSIERGGPLAAEDVRALIAFLRSLTRAPAAQLDERPVRGNRSRGGRAFRRECAKCHGHRGRGGPNVGIGNPELLEHASNGFLRFAIRHGREGTAMPGFEASLGERGIDDIVALLRSYEKPPAPPRPKKPARPPPIPLGPVPLNPKGPEPVGFNTNPKTTKAAVVKQALDRGAKLALLDARAPSAYMAGHIEGAVSVPFYAPEPYFDDLPKDAWLVAYCACPHAESRTLAKKLQDAGFKKVTILDEGLGYWRTHEYGTSRGTTP